MCFTRSSTLVHILPAQFPPDQATLSTSTLTDLIFSDTHKLVMYNLSNLLLETVKEILREFITSSDAELCVLLIDIQEVSRRTINHIRIMIEEEELNNGHQCKLFVLLLHFPPAQLFQHCYPALFLKGWDHIYLDTIAHNTVKEVMDMPDWFDEYTETENSVNGVVDVENWLCKCFCYDEINSANPGTALYQLLPQAISVISAKVNFGKKTDGSFNSNMNAIDRSNSLKKLLFDKQLGRILCDKFSDYWKPKVMLEYMKRAAIFCKRRESTLSITDSIQTQVKALFMDFCVFMLTKSNEDCNLDILYSKDSSATTSQLFCDIFKVFPVPRHLDFLSSSLSTQTPTRHTNCPRFPFFTYIYTLMEKRVELCGEAEDIQLDLLSEHSSPPKDLNDKLQSLVKAVLMDLDVR